MELHKRVGQGFHLKTYIYEKNVYSRAEMSAATISSI